MGKLTVRLKQRPEQPKTEPHFLPPGLSIQAPAFRIDRIERDVAGRAAGRRAARRRGTLEITRWRLDLDPLDAARPDGQVAARSRCGPPSPWACARTCADSGSLPEDAVHYRFSVETRGNLDRLGAKLQLRCACAAELLRHVARPDRRTRAHAARFGSSISTARPGCRRDACRSMSGIDHACGGHQFAGPGRHAHDACARRTADPLAGRGPLGRFDASRSARYGPGCRAPGSKSRRAAR